MTSEQRYKEITAIKKSFLDEKYQGVFNLCNGFLSNPTYVGEDDYALVEILNIIAVLIQIYLLQIRINFRGTVIKRN